LQTHALKTGNYLTQGLRELQSRYPVIGDVRGPGLFLGFELINDPETLEPAADKASYLANRMRQMGVLMSTDGPFHNVLKIKPPMCFDQENAGFLLEYLDMVLREDIMME
ncbi:MAG: aminotransferase class III-fold pyridoxal phosphate-dependent enzyme, partial [Bacteroidetes bacterium]|nr:aminotransferase class III-fold pyridoxal phosphate-dependent enzyme [Bacteroidota bacterium]